MKTRHFSKFTEDEVDTFADDVVTAMVTVMARHRIHNGSGNYWSLYRNVREAIEDAHRDCCKQWGNSAADGLELIPTKILDKSS